MRKVNKIFEHKLVRFKVIQINIFPLLRQTLRNAKASKLHPNESERTSSSFGCPCSSAFLCSSGLGGASQGVV